MPQINVRAGLTALVLAPLLLLPTFAAAQDPPPQGWMGVMLSTPPPPTGEEAEAEPPRGVAVSRVVADGPAARAGLRAGDLIQSVDGHPVRSVNELIAGVSGTEPGSWVAVRLERRGKEREIRVRLASRPSRTTRLKMRDGWIGMEAIDLPPALREHFGAPREAGAMVSGLDEAGPGYASGLELGDVIIAINGEEVRSARHLLSLVQGGGVGNPLEIQLFRSGVEIFLEPVVDEQPADG